MMRLGWRRLLPRWLDPFSFELGFILGVAFLMLMQYYFSRR